MFERSHAHGPTHTPRKRPVTGAAGVAVACIDVVAAAAGLLAVDGDDARASAAGAALEQIHAALPNADSLRHLDAVEPLRVRSPRS